MIEPITYRKVYDKTGYLTAIELVQGSNAIQVTIKNKLDSGLSGHAWQDVKKIVDLQVELAKDEVIRQLNSDDDLQKIVSHLT